MKSFTYTFTVPQDAIDHNGHVHNVTYLSWMIEAAAKHSELVEYGYEACSALGGAWVAKTHHIAYKAPAFANDLLRMETWIDEIGKLKSTRKYRLIDEKRKKIVCEGETEWVFVDMNRMRPMRIPEVIIAAFDVV